MPTSASKWCPRCRQDRPVTEFYKNSGRPDGVSALCITHCRAANQVCARAKRQSFITAMGGACERCGFTDIRALQVDHVFGNGGAERAEEGPGRSKFYTKVLANRDRYMLLCANCNAIKKHEQNETVGARVYARQVPTERLLGPGKGNWRKSN